MLDVILLLALMLVVSGVGFAVRARFVEQSRVANAFEYLKDIQVSQQLHPEASTMSGLNLVRVAF